MAKPRVLISTDIGGDDKDDDQSFIHSLLYADQIDYRGFVATTSDDGWRPSLNHFEGIIDAYARDLPRLREASGDYPSADKLRSLVEQGATDPSWPGGVSDGAQRIIDEAQKASPQDPLYLLAWGPIHDVARALKAAPEIVPNVRVYSIAGHAQDEFHTEAYEWMKDAIASDGRYEELWWINSEEAFRGMYVGPRGENRPDRNVDWVEDNVDGHGALGNLYADVYAKDLYGPNTPDGLKMGDSPSLLYLLDRFNDDTPGGQSWGGSFEKSGLGPNVWVDESDSQDRLGPYDGARTVYKHRSEAWGDFADRLDIAKDGIPGDNDGDSGSTPTPSSPAEGAVITTARIEAEALDLSGYAYEARGASSGGANIKTFGSGAATGVFEGTDGDYEITVGYINETDGSSDWRLLVDGRVAASWDGDGGSNSGQTVSFDVALEGGDEIALTGSKDGGEFARLDWLEISETAPEEDTSPPPAPTPEAAAITLGRTEAESLDLSGYAREARGASSDGANIKTSGSGEAVGVFDGARGAYTITVGYFNENDGASEWNLEVDGRVVESWNGAGGARAIEDASVRTLSVDVALETGDEIALTGSRDQGEFARIDWLAVSERDSDEPAPEPTPSPDGVAVALGRTEAEVLELSGFIFEDRDASSGDANIKTSGRGEAVGVFDGANGEYTVTVGYFNENDGASDWSLEVDGRVVESWSGAGGANGIEDASVRTVSVDVALETGDEIALTGSRDQGEFARIDWLAISESDSDEPAPSSTGPAIGLGRTEAEALELSGFIFEDRGASSGGANIKTFGNGAASGVFDGAADDYVATVGYINEPDGSSDWSLLVNGRVAASWDGDGGSDNSETISVDVALERGDEIVLTGGRDGGEFARLDWLGLAEA